MGGGGADTGEPQLQRLESKRTGRMVKGGDKQPVELMLYSTLFSHGVCCKKERRLDGHLRERKCNKKLKVMYVNNDSVVAATSCESRGSISLA